MKNTAGNHAPMFGVDGENLQVPFLDLLGHGCYLSWCFVVSWCSIIGAAQLPYSTTEIMFFRLSMFLAVMLTAFALRYLANLLLNCNRIMLASVTVVLTLPNILLLLFPVLAWPWLALAWFLAGTGQVLCLWHWRQRIISLGWQQIMWMITWAFILAAVVFTLVSYLQFLFGLVFTLLLPVASMLMYLRASQVDRKRVCGQCQDALSEQRDQHTTAWYRRNLFIGTYSIALGFVTCLITSDSLSANSGLAIGVANLLAGIFMIFVFTRAKLDFSRFLPVLFLPVVAVCFLVFAGIEAAWMRLAIIAVLLFLFACYDILNASAIYVHDGDFQRSSDLLSFSNDRLGNAVGYFMGWSIGFIFYTIYDLDYIPLVLICFAAIVLFCIANTLLFEQVSSADDAFIIDTHNLYRDEQPVLQPQWQLDSGRWRRKCERLAREHDLSRRQTEIFVLLAKGRNSRYIQEKLVLSNHTVKSHIYGIYRKLNIHTRQELIDMLEKH